MQFARKTPNFRIRFLLSAGAPIGRATIERLLHAEIGARNERIVAIEWKPSNEPGVDCIEVQIMRGGKTDWPVEGPKIAEAITLLRVVTHVADRDDGRAFVDRLKRVSRTGAIAATAKTWLLTWRAAIIADPTIEHQVIAKSDLMLWFIADRISALDSRFPGLVGLPLAEAPPARPVFAAA